MAMRFYFMLFFFVDCSRCETSHPSTTFERSFMFTFKMTGEIYVCDTAINVCAAEVVAIRWQSCYMHKHACIASHTGGQEIYR